MISLLFNEAVMYQLGEVELSVTSVTFTIMSILLK